MKSIRSLFILLLISGTMLLGSAMAFAGIEDDYNTAAKELYEFGLFQGKDDSLAVNTPCTKLECAVMLVRILGAENYAVSTSSYYQHKFSDVPEWADPYINYLHAQELITGSGSTSFGSANQTNADTFALLILRAMGYSDVALSEALSYTETIGMFSKEEIAELKKVNFTRGTLAFMARRTLDMPLSKDTDQTFFDILTLSGMIENNSAEGMPALLAVKTAAPAQVAPVDSRTQLNKTVIEQSRKYLGIRYRSGGRSPSTGFDCSGFVNYVLTQSKAHSQWYGGCDALYAQGTAVNASAAQPGDLVFFTGTYATSKKLTHVGIYLGNGQMIHASSSKGISYANIYDSYWGGHLYGFARW